jgi:2-polyprenyl-3-methyl-5-hydroxy-6-metoxy-1,4-benzoquinol methylase
MNSLRHRRRQAEIQDQPDLQDHLLHQALVGLEHINSWSRTAQILWPSIRDLARRVPLSGEGRDRSSPLRILDVATGAGDIPITLWRLGCHHHLPLHIEGCDLNPRTVAFARRRASRQQADVRFFPFDAVNDRLPDKYDVVTCSLFLHHLSDKEATTLLRAMAAAATQLLLVSDLVRSSWGLALAYFATRFLVHSPVNRVDSVRSVRAAFTLEEVIALAEEAGLEGATLRWSWPCRFLLTWWKVPENRVIAPARAAPHH